MMAVTFIVPVGDEDIFRTNFLSSPAIAGEHPHQIIVQKGFRCSGEAYNDGLDRAINDLIICAHQDVVLPVNWDHQFLARLDELNESQWVPTGIVGCIGITHEGRAAGHIYRHDREFFPEPDLPVKVETLDELLISFRKSSGLRFDLNLPSFHFYAVDMCLLAQSRGMSNMAVNAPCFHQGKNRSGKPKEFFDSRKYMAEKWKHILPVHTLSGTLDRNPEYFWQQEAKQMMCKLLRKELRYWWEDLPRIDPHTLLIGNSNTPKGEKTYD